MYVHPLYKIIKMKKISSLIAGVLCTFITCNSQTNESVQKLDVIEFKKQITGKKVQLIDVRTPEEFKEGAIKNAVSINFFDDSFTQSILKFDKEKPVYLYCRSGNRSGKASKIFQKLGFKKIYDLKGGYKSWKKK